MGTALARQQSRPATIRHLRDLSLESIAVPGRGQQRALHCLARLPPKHGVAGSDRSCGDHHRWRPGLICAEEELWPQSLRQRRLAHSVKNVIDKLAGRAWGEGKVAVRSGYCAPNRQVAEMNAIEVLDSRRYICSRDRP